MVDSGNQGFSYSKKKKKKEGKNKIDLSKCPKCALCLLHRHIQATAVSQKECTGLQSSYVFCSCFQYAIAPCTCLSLCTVQGWSLSVSHYFLDCLHHRHDMAQQILPAADCRKDSGYSPAFICNTIL